MDAEAALSRAQAKLKPLEESEAKQAAELTACTTRYEDQMRNVQEVLSRIVLPALISLPCYVPTGTPVGSGAKST